ncbi:MAG: hypothetical protein ACYDBB_16245 [Armatimonadota bacterium]
METQGDAGQVVALTGDIEGRADSRAGQILTPKEQFIAAQIARAWWYLFYTHGFEVKGSIRETIGVWEGDVKREIAVAMFEIADTAILFTTCSPDIFLSGKSMAEIGDSSAEYRQAYTKYSEILESAEQILVAGFDANLFFALDNAVIISALAVGQGLNLFNSRRYALNLAIMNDKVKVKATDSRDTDPLLWHEALPTGNPWNEIVTSLDPDDEVRTRQGRQHIEVMTRFESLPGEVVKQLGIQGLLRTTQKKPVKKLDIPTNLRWNQVVIEFLNETFVEIRVGTLKQRASYEDLGFADLRKRTSSQPSSQWVFLRLLAKNSGEFGRKSVTNDPSANSSLRIPKRIQRLRDHLKELFGIDDDPFESYRHAKAYKTKFVLYLSENYRE